MTEAELAELLADCPRLFHLSAAGSWRTIRRHGLLSTSALLDLFGASGPERPAVETRRRPGDVALDDPLLGRAVIRDQKPMRDEALRRCLTDGLEPADWYRLLNRRVFFWLTRERLLKLALARSNADREHDVLEIDAASLVARHRERITLAAINTGSTLRTPRPRGLATFQPIDRYPYADWRRKRRRGERVVELAVEGGVPDIAEVTLRVLRMRRGEVVETIWEHPPPS